eukprot:g30096.t1
MMHSPDSGSDSNEVMIVSDLRVLHGCGMLHVCNQVVNDEALLPKQQDPEEGGTEPFGRPRDLVLKEERPLLTLAKSTHFNIATLRKLKLAFDSLVSQTEEMGVAAGKDALSAEGMILLMGLRSAEHPLAGPLFRHFDKTKTHQINFRTFVTTLSSISPQASVEDKIKFSFGLMDLQQKGVILRSDLEILLARAVVELSLGIKREHLQEIVTHSLLALKAQNPDKVTFAEYSNWARATPGFLDSMTFDAAAFVNAAYSPNHSPNTKRRARLLTPAQAHSKTQSFIQVVTMAAPKPELENSAFLLNDDVMQLAEQLPDHRLSLVLTPND